MQINFFMDTEDDNEFINMLLNRSDTIVLLGEFYDTNNPFAIDYIPKYKEANRLMLTNKIINENCYCSKQIFKDGREKYMFDLFYDPNIEFCRCYFNNQILMQGRIFAKVGWLKNEEHNKVYKSWYASIERWIKKNYKKIDNSYWIGKSAEMWSLRGGKLVFGSTKNALTKSLGS